jgi:hypothetical protein
MGVCSDAHHASTPFVCQDGACASATATSAAAATSSAHQLVACCAEPCGAARGHRDLGNARSSATRGPRGPLKQPCAAGSPMQQTDGAPRETDAASAGRCVACAAQSCRGKTHGPAARQAAARGADSTSDRAAAHPPRGGLWRPHPCAPHGPARHTCSHHAPACAGHGTPGCSAPRRAWEQVPRRSVAPPPPPSHAARRMGRSPAAPPPTPLRPAQQSAGRDAREGRGARMGAAARRWAGARGRAADGERTRRRGARVRARAWRSRRTRQGREARVRAAMAARAGLADVEGAARGARSRVVVGAKERCCS